MKLAYYPGCSLHSSSKGYSDSFVAVCKKLGIELEEIPDWVCCGASSAHSVSHLLSLALPAHTLVQAEKMGLDMVAPCAACYQRAKFAEYEMLNNPEMKAKIEQVIEMEYKGKSRVLSVLEVLSMIEEDKIKAAVTRPLTGVKVACYYGCVLVRPPHICNVDDPENPTKMDRIVALLGGEPVDWPYKTECCGASHIFTMKDACLKLGRDILQVAKDAGADIIAVACPLCHVNLDMRQTQINKKFGTSFNIPVVYITELMADAMGIDTSDMFRRHFVPVEIKRQA
ncbi:MAG: heterodisulfide reductase subunit [Eubacteriales bacterium]|nr:heterodisulfide reductase subunit [Eubacteriales bacterium]